MTASDTAAGNRDKDRQRSIRLPSDGARIVYFAFDLLYLDGFDLRGAALIDRKHVLRDFMKSVFSDRIRYCDHVEGEGAVVLEAACQMGLEGIGSKRKDQPYRSGKNPSWVKVKTHVEGGQ